MFLESDIFSKRRDEKIRKKADPALFPQQRSRRSHPPQAVNTSPFSNLRYLMAGCVFKLIATSYGRLRSPKPNVGSIEKSTRRSKRACNTKQATFCKFLRFQALETEIQLIFFWASYRNELSVP